MTETQPVPARTVGASERLLVFFHIPKAAGTSFGRIMRCHYGDGLERIGQFRRWQLEVAAAEGRLESARPGARAVSGHLAFGLHGLFPANAVFVTILREPVERTLSQYDYIVHRVGRPWHHDRLPAPTADMTIDDALRDGYVLDNVQTRLLCGISAVDEPLPPDALERAKRNLAERFAYVGTTDRFAEFLALLNLGLGWPTVAYKEGRVTPGRKHREDLPEHSLRAVEEANVLDAELYVYAGELLSRALEAAGPEVEVEAEVLRRALPLERHSYRGDSLSDAPEARSLSVEARVLLALREAELGRQRELARTKARKLEVLKTRTRRRDERIKELKQALEPRSLQERLRGRLGWRR